MSQVIAVPAPRRAGTRARVGAVVGGIVSLLVGVFGIAVFLTAFKDDPLVEIVLAEKIVAAALGLPGAAITAAALPAAIAYCARGRGGRLAWRLAALGIGVMLVAWTLMFAINR